MAGVAPFPRHPRSRAFPCTRAQPSASRTEGSLSNAARHHAGPSRVLPRVVARPDSRLSFREASDLAALTHW